MLVGPVFTREAIVAPRRTRHYVMRTVYAVALLTLICTAWMVSKGAQVVQNVGDMAQFGGMLFQVLAPLQLALVMFLSTVRVATSIAVEKDRETLILLLMSRLTNGELVLGKMLASLLSVGVMLICSLPIFMLIVVWGGSSFEQVGWTFAVTASTALVAGSLGATIAFWREKTFQTLALVGMCIVFWIGFWEAVGLIQFEVFGISNSELTAATSPARAIVAASHPTVSTTWLVAVVPYLVVSLTLAAGLCALAIFNVRKWNPSREIRVGQKPTGVGESAEALSVATERDTEAVSDPVLARDASEGRMDASSTDKAGGPPVEKIQLASRHVWDNPVLWREMRTWAYGRRILFIRVAYWMLAACVFFAIYSLVDSGAATRVTADAGVTIPIAARPLAPFLLMSIVLVNALAVTSITTERDGRALDLLMVTDLSPKEFLFGKLGGVLYVGADMILLPILMCGYLWFNNGLSGENLVYLCIGLSVLFVFVAMLGIHSGMSLGSSLQAIGVSLGTVFFLFLGVVTAMAMMISFTGNVEAQLGPFLACIVGGAIGLYLALGRNTPSLALVIACGALPIAMFYSITSLLLGKYLSVLIVVCFTYGFATMAMMVPRLSEFLVSTERSQSFENGV